MKYRLLLGAFVLTVSILGALEVPSPNRVVSLTLMTDEFLADLLPPERILAYSRSIDDAVLSNAVEAGKAVKGRAWLDLESLVILKPDLILAADWSDAGAVEFLRAKGYPIVVIKAPRTWRDVKDRITSLGDLLGRRDAAQSLLSRLADREAVLKSRAAQVKPLTVLEYNSFGSSMAAGTLWNEMTALAGLTNLSASLPIDAYGYAPLSRELLLKLDPDWLVLPSPEALSSYGQSEFLGELQSDPLYRGLKAVKNGHVIFLSEALKTATSQAVLGAAEALQHAAYPNLR